MKIKLFIFFLFSVRLLYCLTTCLGNLDPLTNCTKCKKHWRNPQNNCMECPLNWNPNRRCVTCMNRWDNCDDDDCGTCLPNFNISNNCLGCSNHWTGSDCNICPHPYDSEKNCNTEKLIPSLSNLNEILIIFALVNGSIFLTLIVLIFCVIFIALCRCIISKERKYNKIEMIRTVNEEMDNLEKNQRMDQGLYDEVPSDDDVFDDLIPENTKINSRDKDFSLGDLYEDNLDDEE